MAYQPGDKILAYNEETGGWENATFIERLSAHVMSIHLDNDESDVMRDIRIDLIKKRRETSAVTSWSARVNEVLLNGGQAGGAQLRYNFQIGGQQIQLAPLGEQGHATQYVINDQPQWWDANAQTWRTRLDWFNYYFEMPPDHMPAHHHGWFDGSMYWNQEYEEWETAEGWREIYGMLPPDVPF